MNHRLTIACLLGTGALVAAAISPARAADATSACEATGAAYRAAVASGDAANVAALYTTDGQLVAPEGLFTGTQAIIAYGKAVKPGANLNDPLKTARAVGGVVLCSGDFVFTFPSGFPIKDVGGHYTKVLIKIAGNYKIAQLTINYTPPPMPRASQARSQ